jgi:hypothetical protein
MILAFNGAGKIQVLSDTTQFIREPADEEDTVQEEEEDELPAYRTNSAPTVLPSPAPRPHQEDDNERHKGDFTLYSYYLVSVGWGLLLLFVFATAVAATGERMPRKLDL